MNANDHVKIIKVLCIFVRRGFIDFSYKNKSLAFALKQFADIIDESAEPIWREFLPRIRKL